MKNFIYNTTLGKCFFVDFGNFIQSNGFNGKSDICDDVFMVIFEEYLSLSNEELSQLASIAYDYDLLMEFRADNNCLIVEFSLS